MAATISYATCLEQDQVTRVSVFYLSALRGHWLLKDFRLCGHFKPVRINDIVERILHWPCLFSRDKYIQWACHYSNHKTKISFLSIVGMGIGYIVLTVTYYANVFNGRDLTFMSTALFGLDGNTYNQTAVINSDYQVNLDALATVGLPRFTTTNAVSQLFYNLSLGAAFTSLVLWHWPEMKAGVKCWLWLYRIVFVDGSYY